MTKDSFDAGVAVLTKISPQGVFAGAFLILYPGVPLLTRLLHFVEIGELDRIDRYPRFREVIIIPVSLPVIAEDTILIPLAAVAVAEDQSGASTPSNPGCPILEHGHVIIISRVQLHEARLLGQLLRLPALRPGGNRPILIARLLALRRFQVPGESLLKFLRSVCHSMTPLVGKSKVLLVGNRPVICRRYPGGT